jgi:3-oxoadipate enol-lactonase
MEPLHDRLAAIRAPTLVVTGSLDASGRTRAEEVVQGVRGARLAVIAGAGHRPDLESPAAFRSLVMSFLKENSVA